MSSVEHDLKRGALVNALGVVGKMAGPSFLVLVTRLYGPDVFGLFITAVAFVEMALALLTAGFKDASLMAVARHADDDAEHGTMYHLVANTLAWSLGLAAMLIVLAWALGPWLLPRAFDYGDRLVPMLRWMALVLPLMAFERTTIAATQGLKIMKYDALLGGGLRPVLLLASAVAFYAVWPGEQGLAAAYVVTQGVVGLLALWVFGHEFSFGRLGHALRHFRLDAELLRFAIPQNLNMTLERFITNVDVIMLGLFGFSAAAAGFYGAGAMIVRELLSIKQVFSNAFVPHIVRMHRQGALGELSRTFSTTSRWIASIAIPAFLLVALLRDDVLALVHPDFRDAGTAFMLWLLVIPYLQCSFGLAGNAVVMTGHSRLNLLNSAVTSAVNVGLNVWLIPAHGLLGAALASAVAAGVKAAMEIWEADRVVGARLVPRLTLAPHLAGLATAAGLFALSLAWTPGSLALRLALAAAALAAYAGILWTLGRTALPARVPDPTA